MAYSKILWNGTGAAYSCVPDGVQDGGIDGVLKPKKIFISSYF